MAITKIDDKDEKMVEEARQGARRWRQMEGLREVDLDVGLLRRTELYDVWRDPVEFPGGSRGTYLRLSLAPEVNPGVAMLPHHEGRVLLLAHDRYPTGLQHLEIPRGFGVKGLGPEEVAAKEIEEELGTVDFKLTRLGSMFVNSGLSDERCVLFSAEIFGEVKPRQEEGIDKIVEVDFAEFKKMICDGRITDSFTLVAVSQALAFGFFCM